MTHPYPTLRRRPVAAPLPDALPHALAQAQARAFLIGMRHVLQASDGFDAAPMQAMRMIMVLPGTRAAATPPPDRMRIALDSLPAAQHLIDTFPAGLREISGELLRDAQGQFYECSAEPGRALRPLGRLMAGPQGRLFELQGEREAEVVDVPVRERAAPRARYRDNSHRARASAANGGLDGDRDTDLDADTDADVGRAVANVAGPAAAAPRAAPRCARAGPRTRTRVRTPDPTRLAEPATFPAGATASPLRALLPPPGKWLQVRYGEFAALLQGQLAQPTRIAADYVIGVYLQVFDSRVALEATAASRWLFGDERGAEGLAPWTTTLAERFGVTLGTQAGAAGGEFDARRGIAAGRRFFALRVASDPSAHADPVASPGSMPAEAHTPSRSTIPPALLCALAPLAGREQAIAQMQHPPQPGWWRRLRQRMTGVVPGAARQAWQQRLAGRSLDEQLWSVPPPVHGLADAQVRDWADRTLRLAGYELPRMADEWEIFWRCRGASD